MLGLATRFAVLPLTAVVVMAIVSTKRPILLGSDIDQFRLAPLSRMGFWPMAHERRADGSMLLGSLFLLTTGGGRWSLDAWRQSRRRRAQ